MASPRDPSADRAVRQELSRHVGGQVRQALPVMALGVVAVVVLLWTRVEHAVLGWWVVAAGCDLVRAAVRVELDERAARRGRQPWPRWWDVCNFASFGLLWGGLVVVVARWGDDSALWSALMVTLAVVAMAVVVSAGSRLQFAVIVGCMMGPAVAVLLTRPGWHAVGAMLVVFTGISWSVHRALHRAIGDAVRVGHENRALADQLGRFLVDRDPATALLNRRGFQEQVELLRAQATRAGERVVVAVANVERLAAVNELFDEATGDAVLRVLAERLRADGPPGRVVARLGGDEFAVAASFPPGERPLLAADLLAMVVPPVVVGSRRLQVELHVADADASPEQAGDLTADVVAQVRRQRAQRRPSLHASLDPLDLRRTLLDELPAALASGAVQPWFQPIVRSSDRRVTGWEALVRWCHPTLGVLSPDRFLPLAVLGGHASLLTEAVLDASLRFLSGAQATVDAKVHVNILPADLRRPSFPDVVVELLRAHRVPADALVLEITEQDLLAVDDVVLTTVERLDRQGVDFAIDDFGTGFSSLTHLQQLPIRQLKIDRSFVARLDVRRSATLVEGIVGLARGMRLGVVAEGVETEEQAARLESFGCKELQGYLFARACPLVDAYALAETCAASGGFAR